MDVEPFPRMKLMKLYYLIMDELKQFPDKYQYKFLCREITKYRMKVVDENESIRDIEETIKAGVVEELILQAHNELKLLRIMKEWQPWEHLFNPESIAEYEKEQASFRKENVLVYEDEPVKDPTQKAQSKEDFLQ